MRSANAFKSISGLSSHKEMKGFVVGGERTEGVFVVITTVQVNKPFSDILNLLYVFIWMRFLTFKVFELMGCVSLLALVWPF